MALFCAAIKRDSVPFFRFPFRSLVLVFSCEISLVSCFKYLYNWGLFVCFLVIYVFEFVLFFQFFLLLAAVIKLFLCGPQVLVLVSAFTLVGLNRLPPEKVICCSLKKILWDLIEGNVPSPTRKNALFAADFPQTH